MKSIHTSNRGSVLLIAMIFIGFLAVSVAGYYRNLVPNFRGTYQAAAWHEALHGAEAGADYALSLLNTWAPANSSPDSYPWTTNNWTYTDSSYATNGERSLATDSLPVLGGPSNVRVTKLTADVYTRESAGSSATLNPWFRIRSTARANLPGKTVSADSRDITLRRMKLAAKTNTGADDPHVTRTVEIIARPRYTFSRAIVTVRSMNLGNSSGWTVDSFDSSDTTKSVPGTTAGGLYPAGITSKIQSNGSIGSAAKNPDSSPYGPLIAANGATVLGDVQTNGGDDPSTDAFENVSGNSGIDQNRIFSNFNEDIIIPTAPTWSSWNYQGAQPASFTTGTKSSPRRYIITGNLSSFDVTPPASGTGYIDIIVDGDLSTGNGSDAGITIPPNVYANIWVHGNIDFGNGEINSNTASSQVASHLTVTGVGDTGIVNFDNDTFVASGNASQILCLNAPYYMATLNGTVTTVGSFIVYGFNISGGGNGGFHYDEALGNSGPVSGWEVASNLEDTRVDL